MTLIAHSSLPAFERLRQEGQEVLQPERANTQNIRELHVGLMNMMPDAALQATERQFLRLVGSSNRIVQFYVHLFSPQSIERAGKAKLHVEQYYEDYATIKEQGLDALIITGANPAEKDMTQEPFWQEFADVVTWAQSHVCSVMCSCFATHAIFKLLYDIERIRLPQKRWGVFSHQTITAHPLFNNSNTRFDAPHSHFYEINAEQAAQAGVIVLANSAEANMHFAVTRDFRFIFSQGHPEYDKVSLLKEYKREVIRYFRQERVDYPVFPHDYFNVAAQTILNDYRVEISNAVGGQMPVFPEDKILPLIDNTWVDTGKSIFNNWLGLVYQITDVNPKIPLMSGLDPANPLGIE